MNKALFLDRDGVINEEVNHLYRIQDFRFIDGVFDTCSYFRDKGYKIIVITNQAGIARGYYTEKDFLILTEWMLHSFLVNGVKIDKVYYCPHHPSYTGECDCRKPNPKMIVDAKEFFNLDLNRSILVGDKNSDIEAGIRAGIKYNFLVKTGHPFIHNHYGVRVLNYIKELCDLF